MSVPAGIDVSPGSWVVAAGSLPPGLSIVNGVLQGVPTLSGSYSFIVCNNLGAVVCNMYFIVIYASSGVSYTFGSVLRELRYSADEAQVARRLSWPLTGLRIGSDIKWIGFRLGQKANFSNASNKCPLLLWGYTSSDLTTGRLLKAGDISYSDMVASDWVFSRGISAPLYDSAKTLQTSNVMEHSLANGFYIGRSAGGGSVVLDIERIVL